MKEMESEFADFFMKMFRVYGLSSLMARLTAILYLEPKDLAMEDLAKRTGYSLASVSNTMKSLEALGVVQRKKRPGTKKIFFFMEKDLTILNRRKFEAFHNNVVKPALSMLPQIVGRYKNAVKTEDSKKKLKIMENYYSQLQGMDRVLADLEKNFDGFFKKCCR